MSIYDQAVGNIQKESTQYANQAYFFLREALNHTMAEVQKDTQRQEGQHVNATELCNGFKDLALKEFGIMAWSVMSTWGVRSSEDIGSMVFQLIEKGVLGRNENDSESDFEKILALETELKRPFLPRSKWQELEQTA